MTNLLKMREQALAPIATFQRTTAGTLNTNVYRLAAACIGIDLTTGRPREIPFSRAAARLLQPIAGREHCFTVTSASLDVLFRKAKAALEIEGLHFHDSRAEALTRLSRKVDVMTLAKISGHKDLRVLQEHCYPETSAQIAARRR